MADIVLHLFFDIGAVKLAVFYHEPPRKPQTLVADIDNREAGKVVAPNIKGFTFDKASLSYVPIDTGPAKPTVATRPIIRSMASVADVVFFKVHMNRILRERHVNTYKPAAKQHVMNRARQKLKKLRNRPSIN